MPNVMSKYVYARWLLGVIQVIQERCYVAILDLAPVIRLSDLKWREPPVLPFFGARCRLLRERLEPHQPLRRDEAERAHRRLRPWWDMSETADAHSALFRRETSDQHPSLFQVTSCVNGF